VFYVFGLFLLLVGVVFLVFGARLYGQPKVGEQISVWRTLVPTLDESAERFYRKSYQSLKASLEDRLPDHDGSPVEVVLTGMGFGPHRLFARHSLFAERPLYLLVKYQHLKCYVYAGQSPAGLYISSWGYSDYHVGEGANRRLVFTKKAWNYFSHQTLFQFDAAIIFTTAVHEILSEIVDEYREEEGLQPLESLERRPVLHSFYQNPFYQDQQAPQNQPYPPQQTQVTGTHLSAAQVLAQAPNFHPAAAVPTPLFAMDTHPAPSNPKAVA
jgi:hypothetical protein